MTSHKVSEKNNNKSSIFSCQSHKSSAPNVISQEKEAGDNSLNSSSWRKRIFYKGTWRKDTESEKEIRTHLMIMIGIFMVLLITEVKKYNYGTKWNIFKMFII